MRPTRPGPLAPPSSRGIRRALAALSLLCGTFAAHATDGTSNGTSPAQLRAFIDRQVGGLHTLAVPANDADLPQPRLANGQPDPFFQTTEAKRYLGKLMFHDPVRTARIRPELGGVLATRQTASCGSCHFGEAASKAGTLLNFAVGGEGRGYTDEKGRFIPRRRARTDLLPALRQAPLFPGDALVDSLPTLTDIYSTPGGIVSGSPALGRKLTPPFTLLATGRLDGLDSVARNAPGVIGFAFNNRLLMGGFAGEPDASPGGLNPFGHPAQENVALLLLDAHRMLENQSAELAKIAVYRKLFRDAFPDEAAQAPGCTPNAQPAPGACDALINDITVFRATASFMRTVVTRDTPWDRFLAGANGALTAKQRRGAKLFFTRAEDGGAGCYGCHSGPMLNKQVHDPDVSGVGEFVEENFHNLGLADHPLQALNRAGRNDPTFRDDGRREITGRDSDAFKFRTLTLRQLKDARLFFHNGSFTNVKDVVRYFNAGEPQDAQAGAATTISPRFTHPRGTGSPRGLGLNELQIDEIADFLENGLYDPGFVTLNPQSPTRTFQLSERDFVYSKHRPDLAALGAKDGFPPSGKAQDNDDPLSRRDMGLEFLDVTARAQLSTKTVGHRAGGHQLDEVRITNNSTAVIDTHLLVIVQGLPGHVRLANASGRTSSGEPYLRVFLPQGELAPGASTVQALRFERGEGGWHQRHGGRTVHYRLRLLSGQGQP
jgi:cytochrome c peroxidase